MRFLLTSIANDGDDFLTETKPAQVLDTVEELAKAIATGEWDEDAIEGAIEEGDDVDALVQESYDNAIEQMKDMAETIATGNPFTIPSGTSGGYAEGGFDWLILPLSA